MRISDWSSDVCSSDLGEAADLRRAGARRARRVEPVDVEAEMNRAVAELRPDLRHQRRQRLVPAFLGLHDAEALGARPVEILGLVAGAAQADLDHALAVEQPFLDGRSEEHTSELQSLMRISYAVFCLTKKK